MESLEKILYGKFDHHRKGGSIEKWVPQNKDIFFWINIIYDNLQTRLLPYISGSEGEHLVEYFPIWMIWGQTNRLNMVLNPGHAVRKLEGYFASGYMAISNRNIYLVSIPELTSKYPLLRKRGFIADFLSGLSGQEDERKPLKDYKVWAIPSGEIDEAMITKSKDEGTFISINSSVGHWMIYALFEGTLELIQTGIIMLRKNKFKLPSQKEIGSDADKNKLMDQLRSLHKAGVISDAEFEEKKRLIQSKLNV